MTTNQNNHVYLALSLTDRIQLIKLAATSSNPTVSGLSLRVQDLLKTKGFNIGIKTIVAALKY